jgi:hypothetical protein
VSLGLVYYSVREEKEGRDFVMPGGRFAGVPAE